MHRSRLHTDDLFDIDATPVTRPISPKPTKVAVNDVRGRFPDSPVLLCDESGGRMAAATIRNRLRHLLALEERPESDWFSPHGMHRACATHNYERGVDLLAIQQLLGHWTVASTMRYVRPSETFIEDAYQRAISATLSELTRQE